MFLDELQQRHPAVLHNLVIGHNGDIDQWKRGAIKLSGGLRVIKLVQPARCLGIWAAFATVKQHRDHQRQAFVSAIQMPLHGGDRIAHQPEGHVSVR